MSLSRRKFSKEFKLAAVRREEASRVAELERKIGRQQMEIDFLKRALQRVEEQRLLRPLHGGATSTGRSKKKQTRAGA